MSKPFLPYSFALKFKELGFDEPCFGKIYADGGSEHLSYPYKNSDAVGVGITSCAAPTYQEVVDWLMDKHKIIISLKHYTSGSFSFDIQKHNGDATGWTKMTSFMEKSCFDYYENYRTAITEALKLIN